MSINPKQLVVQVEDDTKANLTERIEVAHLSDLAEGVKEVVDDFVSLNGGAVLPPVSIQIKQSEEKGS